MFNKLSAFLRLQFYHQLMASSPHSYVRRGDVSDLYKYTDKNLIILFQINRLLQLDWLSDITDAMAGVDLKIIHLLRDPRDVIKSRFKFKHYYYKVRQCCQELS